MFNISFFNSVLKFFLHFSKLRLLKLRFTSFLSALTYSKIGINTDGLSRIPTSVLEMKNLKLNLLTGALQICQRSNYLSLFNGLLDLFNTI